MVYTNITMLWNNRFRVSYRRIVMWAYNTWEVWKSATYEYKKEWTKIFVRCIEREEFTDLEWDEIPEDTWTEKYNYKVISDWVVNKNVIKNHHLEYREKEFESLCEWHEFTYKEFDGDFRVEEEQFKRLQHLILKK